MPTDQPRRSSSALSSSGTRVLIVGSGSFVEGSHLPAVASAEASVNDLAQAFIDRCEVVPENVLTLLDPNDPRQLDKALSNVARQASDVLVFYYIGHGLLSPENELYLSTKATDHPFDELRHGALSYQAVREILGTCNAPSIVVVLDCCFAGQARGSFASPPSAAFQLAATGGHYLLAAAASHQTAHAPVDEQYTAFTGALLRLLTDGDPTESQLLTLDVVYRHLRRQLSARGFHAPHRHVSGTVGELVLVRNPAAPKAIARSAPTAIVDPTGDHSCPYRGLQAFTADDAGFFFGRAELVADILGRLVEFAVEDTPIVAIGVSGVGKSSLLQAGVLPAIARGDLRVPGSSSWPQLCMAPGAHPLTTLADRLAEHNDRSGSEMVNSLRDNPAELATLVGESLRRLAGGTDVPDRRMLLLVDQFEEIFTNCADEAERDAFLAALCALGSNAVVVLCLRADFYSHCLVYPALVTALTDRQILIGPMTENQLRTAIEEPAWMADLSLDPGLTDRLLHDQNVGHDITKASLPLLSYALQQTWMHREGSMLTLAGYEATGGIWEAVTRQADIAYNNLDLPGQQAAKTLLLHMVHIGTNTDDTRRTVNLPAILAERPDQAAAIAAARDALIEHRLITVDDSANAQLSHDALLRAWPRLREWINDDRQGLLLRQQLANDAEEWSAGREESLLYRGTRLAAIEAHTDHSEIAPLATEFLDAARAARRRTQRRSAITRTALALLLVISMIVSVVAVVGFRRATDATDRAESNAREILVTSLITQARAMLSRSYPGDDVRAFQQILAAHTIAPGPQTKAALSHALHVRDQLLHITSAPGLTQIAVSPDGTRLVSGGDDGTIRMWDTTTHQPIGEPLTGHTEAVLSIAFSPDGTRLASGSSDDTIRIWDTTTHQPIGNLLAGHTNSVLSVAFSPDGNRLASSGGDNRILLWDITTRQLWDTTTHQPVGEPLTGHTDPVTSVAFSPDGNRLASGSSDNTIRIWDTTTHQPIGEPLTGHTEAVMSVAFSPDGNRLASSSSDGTIRIWDTTNHQPIGNPLTAIQPSSAVFSPDGTRLASGSGDGTIRIWDATTYQPSGNPLIGHTSSVISVAFSPDGNRLASSGGDNTIRIWDTTPHQPIGEPLTGHTSSVMSVAFSPDGARIASGSSDSTIRIWNAATHQPIGNPLTGHTDSVMSVAFSPDGNRIASGSSDDTIRIWDTTTHQPIGNPLTGHTNSVMSVAFSPDGNRIASGSSDNLRIWDATTYQPSGDPFTGDTSSVISIAFSPDGNRIASSGSDNTIRIWDTTTHQPIGNPLTGHTSSVISIAFSPDGNRIASGSSDNTIRIWDTTTHQPIGDPLTGHTATVGSVAFNPDGTRIASSGGDNTIRIWDSTTHQSIGDPLTGHIAFVTSVAFSPDGTRLASGSADNTILQWRAYPPDPILLCNKLSANMSNAEWKAWISPDLEYVKLCPDLPIRP